MSVVKILPLPDSIKDGKSTPGTSGSPWELPSSSSSTLSEHEENWSLHPCSARASSVEQFMYFHIQWTGNIIRKIFFLNLKRNSLRNIFVSSSFNRLSFESKSLLLSPFWITLTAILSEVSIFFLEFEPLLPFVNTDSPSGALTIPITCMEHWLNLSSQHALFPGHSPYFLVQPKKSQEQSARQGTSYVNNSSFLLYNIFILS